MRNLREAAYSASSDEKRSWDEVYGDGFKLFEDTDDLIDPRFKKLFESVYEGGKPHFERLREAAEDKSKKEEKDPEDEKDGGFDWKAKAAEREFGGKKKESLVDSFLRLREQDSHDIQTPLNDDIEGIPSSLNSSEIGSGGASSDITQSTPATADESALFGK
jgi:hypothetical protein